MTATMTIGELAARADGIAQYAAGAPVELWGDSALALHAALARELSAAAAVPLMFDFDMLDAEVDETSVQADAERARAALHAVITRAGI